MFTSEIFTENQLLFGNLGLFTLRKPYRMRVFGVETINLK